MSANLVVATAPKAVDRRREILPCVTGQLGHTDKAIFEASTHKLISEMDERELTTKCAMLFKGVAMDIGYTIPDRDTWAYQQTRLLDLLRRYYGHLALAEVRLAFEMATMGELNAYLPKDANGNPDNKNYGQFNAAFFGKILTAYQQRQQMAIAAAERAMPKEPLWNEERQAKAQHELRQRCREIFENYRKTGELELGLTGEIYVYDILVKRGVVPEEAVSDKVVEKLAQSVNEENILYSPKKRKAIQGAFDILIKENKKLEELI